MSNETPDKQDFNWDAYHEAAKVKFTLAKRGDVDLANRINDLLWEYEQIGRKALPSAKVPLPTVECGACSAMTIDVEYCKDCGAAFIKPSYVEGKAK